MPMRGETRPLIWALRLATAAYATVLLVVTHLPWVKMPPPGPSVITPDKIYHVAAYGVLGCLISLLRAARIGSTPPVHVLTVALLALLINLAGNLLLVPRWGISGAGFMTFVTEAGVALLASVELRRLGAGEIFAPHARAWLLAPLALLGSGLVSLLLRQAAERML